MKLTDQRLAEMWCELNRDKIPLELEECGFDPHNSSEVTAAMMVIVAAIGFDRCLEEWNRDR